MKTRYCSQCGKDKPVDDFRGKRDPKQLVLWCFDCRNRYGGWSDMTLAEKLARKAPRSIVHGDGERVVLNLASTNRKTGEMPVSMSDGATCPDACGFKGRGCYAELAKTKLWWNKVPERGVTWEEFCRAVASLPAGQIWRHNEAGDLPGLNDGLDRAKLAELVVANMGRRGFTFTHKPLRTTAERFAVKVANRHGFTINLSADNLEHADELARTGAGPVVVVLPADAPDKTRTPEGRAVIVCLNETKGLTCLDCQLCAVADRTSIVGFRAHGTAKSLVSELVRLRRKEVAATA